MEQHANRALNAMRLPGSDEVKTEAAQPSGSYGSLVRPPLGQYVKHGVYLALHMLTASRCYLYFELIAVAE